MKTACFFFACLLAVALAGRAEDDAAAAKAVVECKKEMGFAKPKDTDESFEVGVSDEEKPCLYFCALKKLKLMNEDGTVNKAAVIAIYDPQSEKDRIDKEISNCEKTVQPVDGCKMAQCLHSIAQGKPAKPIQ